MKSLILGFMGMCCFGLISAVLEQKLVNTHPVKTMIYYSSVMLIFALLYWKLFCPNVQIIVTGENLFYLLLVGICLFFGNLFCTYAFTFGGSAVALAGILALTPVAAAIFTNIWTKSWPNLWTSAGCTLAIVSVILIAKGIK